MVIAFTAFMMVLFGGITTLFTTCVIGGDPYHVAPLAAVLVVLTWVSHDVIWSLARRFPMFRLVLTWAYSGTNVRRLRQIGATIVMVQLWLLVSVVPAVVCYAAGHYFNDYLPPWTIWQALGSCILFEAGISLWFDFPCGFIGIARHVRGER